MRPLKLCGGALCIVIAVLALPRAAWPDSPFVRGDVDSSRALGVADAIHVLRHLFSEEPVPLGCLDAADINDSGTIDITDAVFLLNFLFARGPRPPAPFASCGEDATTDAFGCESFARCSIDIYGLVLDGDGIFYAVDRSGSMLDSGELAVAKTQIIRNISTFPESFQFGVVFFDSSIFRFPASGQPAEATPGGKEAAINFVQGVTGGRGSCPQQGLVAALQMANQSTARRRLVVYVGDGGGTCGGTDEATYLRQTVDVVTAMNTEGVVVHTVGVLQLGSIQEEFLRELARRNGGTFVRVDR